MRHVFHCSIVAVLGFALAPASGGAQRSAAAPSDASTHIVSAARAVLSSLDEAGRSKVQFAFDDAAQRQRWSNLPSPMYQRQGLRVGDLTPPQRASVMSLLQAALSADGYRKVTEIMRGDEMLRTTQSGRGGRGGPGGGPMFGEDQYWLAFLGTPSTATPWMLQFGGHHLAINLTMGGAQASMTPSLPAAQPATYTFEGREIRPLGKENDKAFALINALEPDKQKQAILTYRVSDLVLGPGKDGQVIQPEGIRGSALSVVQQTMLLDIVREWVGIMNDGYAVPRLDEIRRNLPQTYFAWSGPTTNGSAAYFRIQGPTLVIEYAPQGSVDHIHTIYRDPTNDYGAKFAAK
jgi:hypothetical protein